MSGSASDSQLPACCICGERDQIRKKLESRDTKRAGDIYKCRSCGLLFAYPLPGIEDDCTPESGTRFENRIFELKKRSFEGYIRELNQLGGRKIKSFLDLGGGIGYYSKAASDLGITATLVELNRESTEIAKNTLGLDNVCNMKIEDFFSRENNKKYDLIFLRHVIEHVKNPPKTIEQIAAALSSDGILIIETPNNNSIGIYLKSRALYFFFTFYRTHYRNVSFVRFLFSRLYAIRPPQHLHIFNRKNLNLLLETQGLQAVKFATFPMGHPVHWPIMNKATLHLSVRLFRKKRYLRSILVFTEMLLNPLRSLLRFTPFASGLSMFAQKK